MKHAWWAEPVLRVLAGAESEYLLAELEAEHAVLLAERGAAAAARWYVQQVLRSVPSLLRHAVRARLRRSRVQRSRRRHVMDLLSQDTHDALRTLVRSPLFAVTAVLTVALGIGATTTIFSVFEAVLLRSLPYGEPDGLVVPRGYRPATGSVHNVTYADYVDWREAGLFEHVAVYQIAEVDLTGDGEPVRVQLAPVTAGFFPALRVRAQLGRLIGPEDFAADAEQALVISHGLWQSRFGGRRDVIGRPIRVSGRPATIVGVTPPRAEWPTGARAWIPMRIASEASPDLRRRDNYVFWSIARLKPGVTLEVTRDRMRQIAESVAHEYPVERRNGVTMVPRAARTYILGDTVPRALGILMGAVAVVLLIGCANVANLMLARTTMRRREFALRSALGASRARVARQLLAESLAIGLLGGALGVLLSIWGVRSLVTLAPAEVFGLEAAGINPLVLGASAAFSIGAALLFGIAPAVHASGAPPLLSLAEMSGRTTAGRHSRRMGSLLVIGQLALSIVLLAGAGLLARSFLRASALDPGFDTSATVRMSFALPRSYAPEQRAEFYRQLTERVRGLPGVQAATVASALPLGAGGFYLGRSFLAEGRPEPPAGIDVAASWNVIGPQYFRTLGMPLRAGREFDERDLASSTPVMIVNQRFVDLMFPGENPLGRRVRSWRDENLYREIVGVVDNVRYFAATDTLRGLVYVPHTQNTWSVMNLLVRTSREPRALVPAIRSTVARLDADLAAADIQTMEEAHHASLATPRFTALLVGVFAVLALLLAAVGVYGVLAFAVAQRTREIGVRVALGAHRAHVLRLIAADSARLIVPGIMIGLAGAWLATRLLRNLLFEIKPGDPVTLGVVVVVLAATAILAAALPARRAARVDPMTVLRDA
jgi:putative ABC transport system permease protein